jgi:hypothetical protein
MAMLELLRRMGRDDLTVHGFRSSFRDWAAECTTYPREVCEMALAHAISDKAEAAYRRGDLFEKRCLIANCSATACFEYLTMSMKSTLQTSVRPDSSSMSVCRLSRWV